MQIIAGRICKLLHDSEGDVNGFVLDAGLDVHFPSSEAARVLAVAAIGSPVEIHSRLRGTVAGRAPAHAEVITNLDSRRSVDLRACPTPHDPEVSTSICAAPRKETPLAPAFEMVRGFQPLATARDVGDEIEHAYDGLHRLQAILVHLKMTNQGKSSLNEYLDEAQHTFVQALSRFEARDFEAARECAAASSGLCRAVDILLSAPLRCDDDWVNPAPSAPENTSGDSDNPVARRCLDRVEGLLARVHWVTENGTLSTEDRAQVEKLSHWGEQLCGCARRLVDAGAIEDAIEFAQAAHAAAFSAEHLCRKSYVTRNVVSQPVSASN